MRRLAVLAPFALAALIAGCGSSSTASTGSSGGAATGTSSAPASSGATTATSTSSPSGGSGAITLSEVEYKITPASATVSKAGKVTITVHNNGHITHALAVQTPSGVVSTKPISPGASATLVVNATKAGKYTFYCPIGNHRMLGMQGTFEVGGSSASVSGGAGAAAPASASTTSTSSTSGGGYAY